MVARDEILNTFDFLLKHLNEGSEDEKKFRDARNARIRRLIYLEMWREWREKTHAVLIEGEGGMGKTVLCNAVK